MFKAKLAGLVVAGLLLSAGAASAAESVFPGSADEAGIRLQSQMTYADRHRAERMEMLRAEFATESASYAID